MKNTVAQLVQSIQRKDYTTAQDQFSNIIERKMRDVVAREYRAVARDFLRPLGEAAEPASPITSMPKEPATTMPMSTIRRGDRVTIRDRFGKTQTGTAVMPSSGGGWVLNMGGKYGTPSVATDENFVSVRKGRTAQTGPGAAMSSPRHA